MTGFNSIFVDTSPFIYFLENTPAYHDTVKSFFESCYQEERLMMTSVVTVEEYCVSPYRNNEPEVIQRFQAFLTDMEIKVVVINDAIARKAAKIRAGYRDFKAMDALQLVAACVMGCDLFFTNDRQLKQYRELPCMLVDERIKD